MPLPPISIALITAIASLLTSTVNVGVGIHTAVQTSKTKEMVFENRHDVSLPHYQDMYSFNANYSYFFVFSWFIELE